MSFASFSSCCHLSCEHFPERLVFSHQGLKNQTKFETLKVTHSRFYLIIELVSSQKQNFRVSIYTQLVLQDETFVYFQSDGTMKGSRDEIGLTLNDFQRRPNHGGAGGPGEERRGNGHDYSPDLARNQSQENRYRCDQQNSSSKLKGCM